MISGVSSSYTSQYFRPGSQCADGSCDETDKSLQTQKELQQESGSVEANDKSNSTTDNADTSQSHKQSEDQESSSRSEQSAKSKGSGNPEEQLSEDDLQKVQELKLRDQEVRAHEAAHLAAAGQYARGGASFSYETGPDGKRYAVGGEVSIDTSPVPGDPEATLQKANTLRAAATAPAEPSAQDRQVAAEAAQMAAEARQEIAQQTIEASKEKPAEGQTDNGQSNQSKEQPGHEYAAIANMDVAPQAGSNINYSV